MNVDKLKLLKKIIEDKLTSIDFEKEIQRNQDILDDIQQTPADECVFSGNIEHGIINKLDTATGVTYPIAYLSARRDAYNEFLSLFDKNKDELEAILNPPPREKDTTARDLFEKFLETKDDRPVKKHFYDCRLTDEDWGSEKCICPGAYIYKKYMSIGLSKEEAKLISDYKELGDLMEDKQRYALGKELYEKHKFLNVSIL